MKEDLPRIDILLATCNGEKFLSEQIESILHQSYSNIRLIIRDDASDDSTQAIIHEYIQKYPDKILFFLGKERVGVQANFSKLMESSSSPYIMFSDQDDVWMLHKVKVTLDKMLHLEAVYGFHPYLVHSDLVVVDENLKNMHGSFWKYINIKPTKTFSINRLLNQNVVTGCTMMINRLMIELARPIPKEAFMHDWWLALVASAFGKIAVINEPTIYYRQHGKNALGAQKFGSARNLSLSFKKLTHQQVRKFHQASTFYHRYNELFDSEHRCLMKAFLNLQRASWFQKRKTILKHGFYKQGFLRNIADFLLG